MSTGGGGDELGGNFAGPTETIKIIASGTFRSFFSVDVGDYLLLNFNAKANDNAHYSQWRAQVRSTLWKMPCYWFSNYPMVRATGNVGFLISEPQYLLLMNYFFDQAPELRESWETHYASKY